jgi:hypothetical protein
MMMSNTVTNYSAHIQHVKDRVLNSVTVFIVRHPSLNVTFAYGKFFLFFFFGLKEKDERRERTFFKIVALTPSFFRKLRPRRYHHSNENPNPVAGNETLKNDLQYEKGVVVAPTKHARSQVSRRDKKKKTSSSLMQQRQQWQFHPPPIQPSSSSSSPQQQQQQQQQPVPDLATILLAQLLSGSVAPGPTAAVMTPTAQQQQQPSQPPTASSDQRRPPPHRGIGGDDGGSSSSADRPNNNNNGTVGRVAATESEKHTAMEGNDDDDVAGIGGTSEFKIKIPCPARGMPHRLEARLIVDVNFSLSLSLSLCMTFFVLNKLDLLSLHFFFRMHTL